MDFFTHLLFGFLLSSWYSSSFYNPYVVLGSLMAILPDFDVLLFPLWKKFKMTGHHGITHTFIFICIAAPITAIVARFFFWSELNLPGATAIMLVTGFVHILCDALTNWGTPILYPLSRRYLSVGLDVAVNIYLMFAFFLTVLFLALVRFRYIGMLNMEQASVIVGACYLSYLGIRAGFKGHYKRKYRNGFSLLPTELFWRWKIAKRVEQADALLVYVNNDEGIKEYRIPKAGNSIPPILTCSDMVYTYYLPEVQVHLSVFKFPYYKISCTGDVWKIEWFVAEMHPRMRIKVEYRNGEIKTSSWW